MLFVLLFLLIVGIRIAYILTGRNMLSACVVSHFMYIISTGVLIINYDNLKDDIDIRTVFIIILSLLFIGLGELYIRSTYFKNFKTIYYPNICHVKQIMISRYLFWFSIVCVVILSFYEFYKFNIIATSLGGSDFVSKYILMRLYKVDAQNGIEKDIQIVPFSVPMIYFGYFVKFLVYFYVYLYLYNKVFKIKNQFRKNSWNLMPVFLYLPVCLFTTSRSVFIDFIGVIGITLFIMIKQYNRGWNNANSNKQILKKGSYLFLIFLIIFSLVGKLKEQDVSGDFKGTVCAYAGASIVGLNEYVTGRFEHKSEYKGQIIFMDFLTILNRIGFNYEMPKYHQEEYVWGKKGEVSNIFSSPYYVLVDLPIWGFPLFYFFFGVVCAFLLDSIRYGRYKVTDYEGYIMTAMVYHSILVISITEAFHHLFGSVLIYSLIAIYIVKRVFVRNNLICYIPGKNERNQK